MSFQSATTKGAKYIDSDIWLTPFWLIEVLGKFDLDPCANSIHDKHIARKVYTFDDNGLRQKWQGEVFLNPPYSKIAKWTDKMCSHGNGILLCFVRSETRWFQLCLKFCSGVNFLPKRISFLNEWGEIQSNGNAPSCLISFGQKSFARLQKVDGTILIPTQNDLL